MKVLFAKAEAASVVRRAKARWLVPRWLSVSNCKQSVDRWAQRLLLLEHQHKAVAKAATVINDELERIEKRANEARKKIEELKSTQTREDSI